MTITRPRCNRPTRPRLPGRAYGVTIFGIAEKRAEPMSAFVRNAWYVAAWQHEVEAGKPFARTILGEPVVLYRTSDGTPVALEDRCCHRALPLSMGRVRDDRIECGYHGLQFDGTGMCVAVPGQTTIPPGARVPRYPLVERDRFVWIWMGETDRMDPDDIPDFHWLDHPDWRAKPSYLHIRCGHQLLIDNLLDLSHLPFVHPTTLGEMGVAETPATTERTARGVRTTRWIVDRPPPPMLAKLGGFTGNIDRWQIVDFIAPSAVILDVGGAPTGTGAPEGDRGRGMSNCNLNAITPETETSLHQFWAQAHSASLTMPGITEGMHDQVRTAFLEDIAFLEAQQKRNEARPGGARVDINADAAHLQARRLMDRLRAEEAAAGAAAG